jgi:ELWxxDGT repeat protein
MLMDLSMTSGGASFSDVSSRAGDKMYFSFGIYGGSTSTGQELYVTDGTVSGSHIVKDINPGINSGVSYPYGADLNGNLIFAANDGTSGTELWTTDGSDSGTSMIKDINSGTGSSYPNGFVTFGNSVFFSASDDSHGNELWKSDGTANGTTLIKDINPGSANSSPGQLVVFNNLVYFVANGDNQAKSLWKSDGTESGTTLVTTFNFGINYLSKINDKLYLSANDGINGQELWVSDGTQSGTTLIDIGAGAGSSNPQNFFSVDSICYFVANGVLWKSQGTNETTVQVSDYSPTTGFALLKGWLYFGANSVDYGNELFKVKVRAFQKISFNDFQTKTFTDTDFAIPASSTSGLPLSFQSSDTTIARVLNGMIHIVGVGTVTITASQDGNDDFDKASQISETLTITKGSQKIDFPAITAKNIDDQSFTLIANATSSLPITFSSSSSKISINGGAVKMTSPGKVTITAQQSGNTNYDSAASVTQEFCINPVKPSITLLLNASIENGLTSSSNVGNVWYRGGTLLLDTTKILNPNINGSYQLQVVIDGCQSPMSDSVSFVVTSVEKQGELKVYPNPASQSVSIDLPDSHELATVSVTDMSGVQVGVVKGTNTVNLDISGFPSGIYFAQVACGERLLTVKIVKI